MAVLFERDGELLPAAGPLPVLPLRDVVVFPYVVMPLAVGRPSSLAAAEAAANGDRLILLVAQRDPEQEDPLPADLYRIGTVARIQQFTRLGNGTVRILVEGFARAKVSRFLPSTPGETPAVLRAAVRALPLAGLTAEGRSAPETAAEIAATRRAFGRFEEYAGLLRRIPVEVIGILQSIDGVERRLHGMAAHLQVRHDARQRLLESSSRVAFARELGTQLAAEIDLLGLERKIDEEVRSSLFQNQREFYLQEQLRAIHRELGNDEGDDAAELETQARTLGMPEQAFARVQREVRKLRRMPPLSPEATVVRNYLDWLLALPWEAVSDDQLDLLHARRILDGDHFGLEEVKDRILDHIAVIARVGVTEGPILCLVGPPGVGKTSLGRSIARALGRKFVRIALGGVRDEAEIRGHRRTYIGAMPGRIIQAMRRAETANPVLLLDEIDKLGADWRGDPSSALLEVLDPEQNSTFSDHYLEVDFDLSRVLFLTTANSLAGIPEPLRDRMEIIRLSGYLEPEKLAIARDFLVPKQLMKHGVERAHVKLADETLPAVLRGWTREAGVRDLERRIARLARKVARRDLEQPGVPLGTITPAMLPDLLGQPPHDPDDLSLEDRVGVANGLAFTTVGGETLEVEVSVVPGRGRLQLTGTLGDVMKESATAALSYVRSRVVALGIDRDFHRTRDIHVHFPAGATPKDGPSAGIAIAVALASALTGRAVRGDVAMTGEITLRGRVLPIGGLKEKSVAAHRSRVRALIAPRLNERDLHDIPDVVRSGLEWHFVSSMDEVLELALRRPVDRLAAPAPRRRSSRAVPASAPAAATEH
jgi:ATP-dependent Lon protease